jgi:TIR domain
MRKKLGRAGPVLGSITDGIERIRKTAKIIRYAPSDVLWEIMPREPVIPRNKGARVMEWDVFISHASEDKEGFARPLAEGLTKRGLKVWFDEFTLTVGDSLRRSIDRGLAQSRFGVVVISPDFLRKEWPQKELDGLVAREVDGVKVILPVWHRIRAKEIRAYSPTLADRVAASSDKGLDQFIAELIRAIRLDDQSQKTTALEQLSDSKAAATAAPMAVEIVDLWVNMEYLQKSGLIEKLKADGYDVYWERAMDEATRIDLEGWEHVIVERPDGTRARLKIRDAPILGGYIVLLKRKKGFESR